MAKARVIKELDGHQFRIGAVVEIIAKDGDSYVCRENGEEWYLGEDELDFNDCDPTIEQTESAIIQWAQERQVFDKASSKDQFVKMVEEVGEIAECLSKNRPIEELELEIGDLMVTAIILASKNGTSISSCLSKAYEKISNRTGKTVDGVFIRD